MRVCDNCGTMGDGRYCERCGKPFPPPVPMAPRQEQVEFEPGAEPQRPEVRVRPTGQRIQLPAPGEPQGYAHETFRPHTTAEIGYGRPRRPATAALVIGVLSVLFSLTGGVMGLFLGAVAVILGRRARDQGLERAGTAIALGFLGIGLSVLFYLVWWLLL
jgi:hypothetical protein